MVIRPRASTYLGRRPRHFVLRIVKAPWAEGLAFVPELDYMHKWRGTRAKMTSRFRHNVTFAAALVCLSIAVFLAAFWYLAMSTNVFHAQSNTSTYRINVNNVKTHVTTTPAGPLTPSRSTTTTTSSPVKSPNGKWTTNLTIQLPSWDLGYWNSLKLSRDAAGRWWFSSYTLDIPEESVIVDSQQIECRRYIDLLAWADGAESFGQLNLACSKHLGLRCRMTGKQLAPTVPIKHQRPRPNTIGYRSKHLRTDSYWTRVTELFFALALGYEHLIGRLDRSGSVLLRFLF